MSARRLACARLPRLPSALLAHLALVLCLCLALSSRARADDVRPFRFDARLELPLLSAGVASWMLSEALKPNVAPRECRLCGTNAFDGAVQRRVRWARVEPAHRTSDVLLFGIVPLASLTSAAVLGMLNGRRGDATLDALVVVESLVLAANITQLTKFVVGRERPFVHTQRAENRDFVSGPDDHLSFFSGHTSATFSLAVAAGATASFRGYKQAPIVWAVGLPLAALTGYLRLAADRHYFTDVLTGALVGSAVGVLVPWLHARGGERAGMPAVSAAPNTLMFSWVR